MKKILLCAALGFFVAACENKDDDDSNNGVTTTTLALAFNLDASAEAPEVSGDVVALATDATAQPRDSLTENGYTQGQVTFNETSYNIPSADHLTAEQIAAEFSEIDGIDGLAETYVLLTVPEAETFLQFEVNGTEIVVDGTESDVSMEALLLDQLNLQLSDLVSSAYAMGGVLLRSEVGSNIHIVMAEDGGSLNITGMVPTAFSYETRGPVTISHDGQQQALIGGVVDVYMGYDDLLELDQPLSSIYPDTVSVTSYTRNIFQHENAETYNQYGSLEVFDRDGDLHLLSFYFVRESPSVFGPNVWSFYPQINGRDVGGVAPGDPTTKVMARYFLRFDSEGDYNQEASDTILIENWVPHTKPGLQPMNIEIDVTGSTQICCGYQGIPEATAAPH